MGYLAIIFAAVFWGFSAPVQKMALSDFTPSALSFWRFLFASILFSIYFLKTEKFPSSRKDLIKVLGVSSLFSLAVVFYVNGLKYTTVSSAQALSLSLPIFNTLGSVFLLKEKVMKELKQF